MTAPVSRRAPQPDVRAALAARRSNGNTIALANAMSNTPSNRKRRPIETRKPTGHVSWPTILVEGGEGSGKSYAMAQFTADDRIGRAFWFDIGEGAADEFGGVGNYEIVAIDGTWDDLIDQVLNVVEIAEQAAAAGDPPVVACFDSVSSVWDMCSGWAYARAARSKSNATILKSDPDADINIGPLVWTNAKERWYQFFRPLKMAPMIAVMAAKAAETVAIEGGRPVQGKTAYKIRAQKELPYDVNAIVRLSAEKPPVVTKCRSPKWGIRPGVDEPKPFRDLTLGRLIFDGMGFDPRSTQVPDQVELEIVPDLPVAVEPVASADELGRTELTDRPTMTHAGGTP